MSPFIVSSIFVLGVMALCLARPNAGRIFLGFFYLAMALAINGMFILSSPQSYADYAAGSFWPLYRDLATAVVGLLTPLVFGVLLATYEVVLAVLLLSSGQKVKLGLVGVIVFILGITPLSTLQIPWLGIAVAAAYLWRHDYPRSVVEMLSRPAHRQAL